MDNTQNVTELVGSRLRARRLAHGLTTYDLGDAAGIDASCVSRIERGLQPRVRLDLLARLARAVGSTLADLVREVRR